MVDPELLALLVCPATHQDVVLAGPEEIARLNAEIGADRMRTVGGLPAAVIEGALVRADRAVAYPIRDGIPIMLIAEALVLSPVEATRG